MKKPLFVVPFLLSGFFSLCLAMPDSAVNFTAKDVDGKSHTLFTYLNAGKYVLLDFVTTT
jgi:hypothetical protein